MKYAVTTRFVFTGTFFVEAESKTQAKEYVDKHCGMALGGGIHSSLSAEDADWDFPIHPDKITGRIRRQHVPIAAFNLSHRKQVIL
jgi:hypothetical protein